MRNIHNKIRPIPQCHRQLLPIHSQARQPPFRGSCGISPDHIGAFSPIPGGQVSLWIY